MSREVILNPVTISRNESEQVFIEPSINAVRVSIKIKQVDEIERILVHMFMSFLMGRAESFIILRRRPLPVRGSCRMRQDAYHTRATISPF